MRNILPSIMLPFDKGIIMKPHTCARTGPATRFNKRGFIENVANNTPRINYDSNGVCLGLLCEPGSTNTVEYSEDLTNGVWNTDGVNVTLDGTTTPSSLTNSSLVETDGTTGVHRIFQNTIGGSATNGTYSGSAFLRYKDHRYVSVAISDNSVCTGWVIVDLLNGVISNNGVTGGTLVRYSISELLYGGYYRVTLTVSCAAWDSGQIYLLQVMENANAYNTTYTGTGTGVYIWGEQFEEKHYATSYIPTVAGGGSRTADINQYTYSSGIFDKKRGTFLCEFELLGSNLDTSSGTYYQQAIFGIYRVGETFNLSVLQYLYDIEKDGTYTLATNYGSFELGNTGISMGGGLYRTAGKYTSIENDLTPGQFHYINGVQKASTNNANVAINNNPEFKINLGFLNATNADSLFGHIKKFSYYPTDLTNDEIAMWQNYY